MWGGGELKGGSGCKEDVFRDAMIKRGVVLRGTIEIRREVDREGIFAES